ncbi:MAG: hypothetical protein ACK4SA_14425, partial [Caldilinea sp.]
MEDRHVPMGEDTPLRAQRTASMEDRRVLVGEETPLRAASTDGYGWRWVRRAATQPRWECSACWWGRDFRSSPVRAQHPARWGALRPQAERASRAAA